MTKRKRRTFTAEFKTEAVRLCQVGDRSIARVARDLDLTVSVLRTWVKQHEVDAGRGPAEALTTVERDELRKLRREVLPLKPADVHHGVTDDPHRWPNPRLAHRDVHHDARRPSRT